MKNELIKTHHTKSLSRKGLSHFRRKDKMLKTMSKGGYIWTYFGFCWVVVHFSVGGGWWWIYLVRGGWWWVSLVTFSAQEMTHGVSFNQSSDF